MANVTELAARLSKAVADRTAIDQLTAEYPDLDLAAAYRVQRAQRPEDGQLGGWKLGVTSRAKQQQVGLSAPTYGFLRPEYNLDLGAPLDTSELIAPRAEPVELGPEHVSGVHRRRRVQRPRHHQVPRFERDTVLPEHAARNCDAVTCGPARSVPRVNTTSGSARGAMSSDVSSGAPRSRL
ncbi:MAG: 2-oxo-3-hexenedioate decarboxylase, partial [Pseudonocardiales bacterium]|nr:2-oxo-3-hexenedioate decarboxylase [Pseudonocardiales bacterium]